VKWGAGLGGYVGMVGWLREERLRGENGGLCGEKSLAGEGDGFPG
jgi:hypothetical protein